ncbi:MAG: 4-hydroxy-tetrahydrodipicolinate reductase [Candidatus Omnitrophota bacterium]
MIKLGISGVYGRMGRRIFELASHDKDFEVNLALEKKGTPAIGREMGNARISSNPDGIFLVDVFIDFSTPQAAMANLDYLARYKKAAVIGVTGLNEEELKKLQDISKVVPLVFSPNMAVGVNILFDILPEIAKSLGPDYNVEVIEAHHRAKKDAPSGTAKKICQILSEATGRDVPVHAIRLGDIVGDHSVIFCGNSERIEITHRAHSRDLFALGALKAAKWIAGKPAGLYSMRDVLTRDRVKK